MPYVGNIVVFLGCTLVHVPESRNQGFSCNEDEVALELEHAKHRSLVPNFR